MFAWLRSLLGQGPPSRRELMACKDAVDALESRIDNHYAELKSLRGVVNATLRHLKSSKEPAGETIEPGDGNDDGQQVERRPAPTPTSHLARRFRIGG